MSGIEAKASQKFYDVFARNYDQFYDSIDYPTWAAVIQLYITRAIRTPRFILEVGCGTGSMLIEFSKPKYQYCFGVDISKAMLDICKKKLINDTRVRLTQGNALQLGFTNNIFDVVLGVFSLINLYSKQNMDAMLHEVFRVMRSGGLFFTDFATIDYCHWLHETASMQQYSESEFVLDQSFANDRIIGRRLTTSGVTASQQIFFFETEEIKNEFKSVGFEIIKIRPIVKAKSKTSRNRLMIVARKPIRC